MCLCACVLSCSVVSNSLQSHELQPTKLLCPQDFPGKKTAVGCHFLLQWSIGSLKGKKEEILTYETARINLENIMLSEINQSQILYNSTFMLFSR